LKKPKSNREPLFDYLRSIFMLFVFIHHFYLSFPNTNDYVKYFNPFAELFVGLAGFMVGFIYLHRQKDKSLIKRGIKIIIAYYVSAIPINLIASFSGNETMSIFQSLLNVLLFREYVSWVGILKFYGVIFIILPLILTGYRKSPILAMLSSIFLFIVSTLAQELYQFTDIFVTKTLITTMQWQLFFVIGLRLGDLYKTRRIKINSMYLTSVILVIIGLILQFTVANDFSKDKYPYNLSKLFNTMYLAPLYLLTFKYFYKWIVDKKFDNLVRVVGRNSLIAFVLSEFIRYFFIWGPTRYFDIKISELLATLLSILFALLLIFILKIYEENKDTFKLSIVKKRFANIFN
jgi:hypothetical protein